MLIYISHWLLLKPLPPNVFSNKLVVPYNVLISKLKGRNISVPSPSQFIIMPPIIASLLLGPCHFRSTMFARYYSIISFIL